MSQKTLLAQEMELIVPLSRSYFDLAQNADDFLWARLKALMPDQCSWCGSDQVCGTRWIRLYTPNPGYMTKAGRAVAQGAAFLVGGVVSGAVGGGLAGASMIHGMMSPTQLVKFKGVIVDMLVPHCAEHAAAPPEWVFSVTYPRHTGNIIVCPIRVRDAAYAEAIVAANASLAQPQALKSKPAPVPTTSEPIVRSAKLKLSVNTMQGFVWPDRCVVCGSPDISARYPLTVKKNTTPPVEETIEVPVCPAEELNARRANKVGGVLALSAVGALLVVAALTFVLNLSTGVHIGVCAAAGLAIVLAAAGIDSVLAKRMGLSQVMNWKPITIEWKNSCYMLTFNSEAMADTVFALNQQAHRKEEPEVGDVGA